MGDLYILWSYIYTYAQGQGEGQTLSQPESLGPDNLNSAVSFWPPATMAIWKEEPHQPSGFVYHVFLGQCLVHPSTQKFDEWMDWITQSTE